MRLRRKKGWIGVDLGSRAVKLAQVERAGSQLRVVASAIVHRSPADRDASGPVVTRGMAATRDVAASDLPQAGSDVVTALSLDPAFSGYKVACMLPMGMTDLHVMEIPPGQVEERRAMVANELASIFQGETAPREFDFWATGSPQNPPASGTENVNVLSVPREVVSRVIGDLSRAKLHCEVLDGLPLALARSIGLAYGSHPGTPVGAIDWGFSSATFCVVVGEKPVFTRHLRNCGLRRWAEALGQSLGLGEEEALELLSTYGMPDPDCPDVRRREVREMIAEIVAGRLNEMAEEIRKTVAYLRMQSPGASPQRLCLLGSGATVKQITSPLAEKVGLPVEVWQLPQQAKPARRDSDVPLELLGTAVALSALAWA